MSRFTVRSLTSDDFTALNRLEVDVFGALGEPTLCPHYLRLCTEIAALDGDDPSFAPGTGTPLPGGMTTRELFALLRGIVGMDVVEICPMLDHADLTAHLGAHLLFEGRALRAIVA